MSSFYDTVWFNQVIFLLTGIITTIGNQYVTYMGAASQGTLLPVACTYYGMAMAYFLPKEKLLVHEPAPTLSVTIIPQSTLHTKIMFLAFVDFIANALGNFGIIYAGSGIYQVVHSAVVTFTAIWATLFLGKKLTMKQWIAITIVTFGLMFSALGSLRSEDASHSDADSGHVFKGFILTLISTMLFSGIYCLAEDVLTSANAPSPQQLQTMTGAYSAMIVSSYLMLYTIPRYDSLIVENVATQHGNPVIIVFVYIILLFSAFGHAVTYFRLMGSVGAVSTGILQALRAVTVFFISASLFSRESSSRGFKLWR